MKKFLSVLMVLLATGALFSAMAAPVDGQKARLVATNFLKTQGVSNINLVDVTATTPFTEFYVFAGSNGRGFVLVSGDDCVVPILGYSADNAFVIEGMPTNVRGWLDDCEDQIRFYRNASHRLQKAPQQADTPQRQWENLLNGRDMAPNSTTTAVAPLLSTTWNQSPLYNNLCPYDYTYSERTVTGCVATAVAQVMKFWNHPTTGYGSNSYTSNYGTHSANFGTTTYAWSSMPNSLTSSSTSTQINAVATLMYHIGVALEMDYGVSSTGGSGAYTECFQSATLPCAENALRYYFKYKSSLRSVHIADYTSAQWSSLLTNDLTNGRPVIYSGRDSLGGHCFVCDGCNNSGQFHFNWGWGGYCDGYYTIGSLNPSSGGTGASSSGTYNLKNTIIVGIIPNTDFGSSTSVTAVSNNSTYGTVTGGGSYTGTNSNLVTISATANSGYRFNGWTDGYKDNPRQFYANGGTYTFTANFSSISGDTMFYCSPYNVSNYGNSGGTTTWGIKLPASTLTANHDLTKIHMYIITAGSYTLNIYTGTTSPTTTAYTTTFTAPSSLENHWAALTLATPVPIDGTQSVWVVLQSNENYPAATSYYAGNNDSRLWGTSLTPTNYGSFMIRAIFANNGSTPPPLVAGDTVSYCDTASYVTSIGTNGGAIGWGIKLPAAMYSHRSYVSGVMLYVPLVGTYTMNIYQGATPSSSTLVATQNANFGVSGINRWQVINLTNPIATSSTQPLWVTFNTNGITYPAAACAYTGDTNSCLVSLSGTDWMSIQTASGNSISQSWMIKAILTNNAVPNIQINGPSTVSTGVPSTFSVSGPATTYSWTLSGATPSTATGDTVTATWSTAGTYNVIVNATYGGYSLSDTLVVTAANCAISTFPYTMGFESTESMTGWNLVDADGDGYGWEYVTTRLTGSTVHSGSNAFASASYINSVGVLTPDNWLVTPQIQLASGHTYTLTWWDGAVDASYYNEHYSVYLSTTGNTPSSFSSTPLLSTTLTTNNFTKRTVDLSSYAGQTVYLAFRHHNVSDVYWLVLDDLRITQDSGSTPASYTITVLANDNTMGTVSGGGTYASGATATLTATAFSGYHFVQWNDGYPTATRTITVTSNATYTAYFAANAVMGDTVSYCDTASYATAIGTGGAIDWGICLPASMVSHRSYVTAAMLYVAYAGSYTLNIYQGTTTSSSTLVATKNVSFGSSDIGQWQVINLTTPVATSSTQPLWVTFHTGNISYPATACAYNNDTNSCLVSLDGTNWMSILTASEGSLSYSWLIKAVLSNNAAPSISISGPATVSAGTPATFTANGPAAATYSWTLSGATPATATGATATATWNTAGTYNVILTATVSGTTLHDTLAVTVVNCAISTFPYEMGFEATDDMTCWNIYDQDGDGYSWVSTDEYFSSEGLAHSGDAAFGSASYINNIGSLTPDNWLVTPQIQLASGHSYTLTWWDGAVDASYYDEHYSVYVSTTGNQPSNFTGTPLFSTTLTTADFTQRTVDLSSYAGQNIFIAFRHHNSEDVYWLLIDDLVISQTEAPESYTVTVRSDNPAMGSATGGGTFPYGATTTISAHANSGYHFTQWNDGNTYAIRTITVTGDVTYTAYFAEDEVETYTVTVLSANDSMGYVEGGGTYPAGSAVTISAIPYSGFHFVNWNDGNDNAIRTITVTADATYVANFERDAVGIRDIDGGIRIATLPGNVVSVIGADNSPIAIYDLMGRQVASQNSAEHVCNLQLPAAGVYMVLIDSRPAQRVVVR